MSEKTNENGRSDHTNELIKEKSPYLLQHAHNPVDWRPWGQEAFDKAKRDDKPIFLSVGYSTCHWCHVMAHESFEDPEVADLMNQVFISIKVDREERPDVDDIYMTACQMMTGSGGWPLTIIMTPDKKPFFSATYIPKHSFGGRVGMMDLIPRIGEIWKTRRQEVLNSADQVTDVIRNNTRFEPGEDLDETDLKRTYEQLSRRFDPKNGGFSDAPKFPSPHNLVFLLRYWNRMGNKSALEMVEKTLTEMRRGGIFDHVGFGFHRYSTDGQWLLPHFEKMLYDQALLALAYLEAHQATGKKEYADTARDIFTYVLRDLKDPGGGFHSAEDADSEGEEGKFYVWTVDELTGLLGEQDAKLAEKVFHCTKEGNFTEEATRRRTGANILHLRGSLQETARRLGIREDELAEKIEGIRQRLFAEREKRIRPHKDDKVLTDWNGLMIAALSRGARVLDEPTYAEAAKNAVNFIFSAMRTDEGRLLHRYRDNEAAVSAHADDYAFLIWGLLELYEATFVPDYFSKAVDLHKEMTVHFLDKEDGAFYSTADDSEEMLIRNQSIYDGAIPSGNSVAAWNAFRLARMTGDTEYEEIARRIGRRFSKQVKQIPSAHTQLMIAMDFGFGPSSEVVIAGDPEAEDTRAMIEALRRIYAPRKVVLLREEGDRYEAIRSLAGYIEHQKPIDGRATAYVCRNFACGRPTTDAGDLAGLLNQT